jgi:hypothetical protein
MRLLALLVEDYDRRNPLAPDHAAPGERLRFLIQHPGETPGNRRISAEQARKLGRNFSVKPGLFIE